MASREKSLSTNNSKIGVVQDHTHIHDIPEGILRLKDGTCSRLYELSPFNHEMASSEEIDGLSDKVTTFFDALNVPIQLAYQGRNITMQDYVERFRRNLAPNRSPGLVAHGEDFIRFLETEMSKEKQPMEHHHYLVMPYSPPFSRRLFGLRGGEPFADDKQFVLAKKELETRENKLGGLSIKTRDKTKHAGTREVLEAMRRGWVPKTELKMPLARFYREEKTKWEIMDGQVDESDLARFDVNDLLASPTVIVRPRYMIIDGQVVETYAVTEFPPTMLELIFKELIGSQPLDLSVHITPLNDNESETKYERKYTDQESTINVGARQGLRRSRRNEIAYEQTNRILDKIVRREQRVFSTLITASIRADGDSPVALDQPREQLMNSFRRMGMQAQLVEYDQDRAFRTTLPYGRNELLMRNKDLNTPTVTKLWPGIGTTLAVSDGTLIGMDETNNTPVLVKPFDRRSLNYIEVVAATAGGGKDYYVKSKLLRAMQTVDEDGNELDVMVVDANPKQEYGHLAEQIDGEYVQLSKATNKFIQPLELPKNPYAKAHPLVEQVIYVGNMIGRWLSESGQELSTLQKEIIDDALFSTYAGRGISEEHPETLTKEAPLIVDVQKTLASMDIQGAKDMAKNLNRYVTGSLGGLLLGPSNINYRSRFVVFDASNLEGDAARLALDLTKHSMEREIEETFKPRALVFGEASIIKGYPGGVDYMSSLAKLNRHYYLWLIYITQSLHTVLEDDELRSVIDNASRRLMLNHTAANMNAVQTRIGIPDQLADIIKKAEQGHGVYFDNGYPVRLHVVASPLEDFWDSTAPMDRAKRLAERQETERLKSTKVVKPRSRYDLIPTAAPSLYLPN